MSERMRLPNRRLNESLAFVCHGQRYVATLGFFENGNLAEIFLQNAKLGSHADASAKDSAILASLGLQYGIPLSVIRHSLLRDARGTASSPVGMALDLVSAKQNDAA